MGDLLLGWMEGEFEVGEFVGRFEGLIECGHAVGLFEGLNEGAELGWLVS